MKSIEEKSKKQKQQENLLNQLLTRNSRLIIKCKKEKKSSYVYSCSQKDEEIFELERQIKRKNGEIQELKDQIHHLEKLVEEYKGSLNKSEDRFNSKFEEARALKSALDESQLRFQGYKRGIEEIDASHISPCSNKSRILLLTL